MLTEQLRPKKLEDVVGQKEIVNKLKEFVKKGEIPNLLFYGNPGVGKTTVAHIIGREILGKTFKTNFIDMNASSDRGIDTIRGLIQERAKVRSLGTNKPKIIFLDEAEMMTRDAQTALRRIMEDYYKTCRFILSCNFIEKIIEPIRDRCSPFHFKDIPYKTIAKYLLKKVNPILSKPLSKKQVIAISKKANGSLRRALNLVEAGYNKEVKIEKPLLSLSTKEFFDLVYSNEYDPDILFQKLHQEVVSKKNIKALVILADTDYRMSLATNKMLQLMSCFVKIRRKK